jgi:hypothetical protein
MQDENSAEKDTLADSPLFHARRYSRRRGRGNAMIGREVVMTGREELHKLIDGLPEEQIAELRLYVEDLQSGGAEGELDAGTLAAIREGIDDITHGRVMDLEEYRRTRGL